MNIQHVPYRKEKRKELFLCQTIRRCYTYTYVVRVRICVQRPRGNCRASYISLPHCVTCRRVSGNRRVRSSSVDPADLTTHSKRKLDRERVRERERKRKKARERERGESSRLENITNNFTLLYMLE